MPTTDRLHVLWHVATIVEGNKWCTLDVETTGLGMKDQVIEVGVCGLDLVAHSWRIGPTVPVTPEATTLHGITDDDWSRTAHRRWSLNVPLSYRMILNNAQRRNA